MVDNESMTLRKKKDTSQKPEVFVSPIVVPRAQDVLANQLRDRIMRREIAEGQSLPSERDLVEQTGLTRGVVREALRMLAAEGFIQTKPGRTGGSIATLPTHESMASAIYRFVQGRRISVPVLQETRELLEPFLARMAAQRRTDAHVKELKALHAELVSSVDDFQKFTLANLHWHNAVGKASGNDLLSTLLYSISHGVQLVSMADEYDTPETRKQVIDIHARVNAAIEEKNPEKAESSMRKHMSASRSKTLQGDSFDIPLVVDAPMEEAFGFIKISK